MANEPINPTAALDTETTSKPDNFQPLLKHPIYPEMSNRFTNLVVWLGVAFIVMAILIQRFSGFW